MQRFFLLLFVFATAVIAPLAAQSFPELDVSPMDAAYFPANAAFRSFAKTSEERHAATPVARVIYSRPQKKGRQIYGKLVQNGKIWRIGANESTEMQVFQPMSMADRLIPPGRYTLYATPEEDAWTIHINAALDGWGAYTYRADYDVAKVTGPVTRLESPVEALSIVFVEEGEQSYMLIAWGDRMVQVPVRRL